MINEYETFIKENINNTKLDIIIEYIAFILSVLKEQDTEKQIKLINVAYESLNEDREIQLHIALSLAKQYSKIESKLSCLELSYYYEIYQTEQKKQ